MRRRRKSRGGEGEGGRGGGEEGGGCSHIVMVQTIPELIAYPCLFLFRGLEEELGVMDDIYCWIISLIYQHKASEGIGLLSRIVSENKFYKGKQKGIYQLSNYKSYNS